MAFAFLRTERLSLRPWVAEDLDALHAIWSDPEVVWWGPSADLDASRRLLDAIVAESLAFPAGLTWYAIVERTAGAVVGNVMVRPAPYAAGEIDVGWTLARASWGKGYATEAARAAIRHAFSMARPARLVAAIFPTNERSLRVAARLGFTRAGTVQHAGLAHDLFEVRP